MSVDPERVWRGSLAVTGTAIVALVVLTLASVPFGDAEWLRPAYYAAIPAALVSPALPATVRGAHGRGPGLVVAFGVVPGVTWTLAVVVARGVSRLFGDAPAAGDAPLWGLMLYFVVAGVVAAGFGYAFGRTSRFVRRRL